MTYKHEYSFPNTQTWNYSLFWTLADVYGKTQIDRFKSPDHSGSSLTVTKDVLNVFPFIAKQTDEKHVRCYGWVVEERSPWQDKTWSSTGVEILLRPSRRVTSGGEEMVIYMNWRFIPRYCGRYYTIIYVFSTKFTVHSEWFLMGFLDLTKSLDLRSNTNASTYPYS